MSWYGYTESRAKAPPPTKKSTFNNAWKHRLTLTEDPLNVIILKGNHDDFDQVKNPITGEIVKLPYDEYLRHTKMGPFRTFMCTSHLGECEACDRKYNQNDDSIARRRVKYFTAVVLEEFVVEKNSYGDETWHMLKNLMPAEVSRLQESGAELRFGRKYFLDLGKNHTDNLLGIAKDIRNRCHCGGKVFPRAYTCGSCGVTLEDMETTTLKKSEFAALAVKEQRCGNCGTAWFPDQVNGCTSCEDPNPWELFDVVLNLVKRGEKTSATIAQTSAPIVPAYEWILPNGEPLFVPDLDDWNPLIRDLMTPFNFKEVFSAELDPVYQKQFFN